MDISNIRAYRFVIGSGEGKKRTKWKEKDKDKTLREKQIKDENMVFI